MYEYFHFSSVEQHILFKRWSTNTYGAMVGSAIAVFIVCILYELFKGYRENVMEQSKKNAKQKNTDITEESPLLSGSKNKDTDQTPRTPWKKHLYDTLLHVINLVVGYLIMLIVMTYNMWLFLAVISGCALGFYITDRWRSRKQRKKAVLRKIERKSCNPSYGGVEIESKG